MLADDMRGACAAGLSRQHVFLLLDGQHLAAHLARHAHPVEKTEDDEDGDHARAELHNQLALGRSDHVLDRDGQQDHDQHVRQGVDDIDDAHHDHIDLAAEITGDCAVNDADHHDDQRRDEADHQRNARAVYDADAVIAAEIVRAHNVREDLFAAGDTLLLLLGVFKRRHVLAGNVLLRVGVRIELRHENRNQRNDNQQPQAGHGHFILAQAAHRVAHEGGGLPLRQLLRLFRVRRRSESGRVDLEGKEVFLRCFIHHASPRQDRLILGSITLYSTSARKFIRMIITARKIVMPMIIM